MKKIREWISSIDWKYILYCGLIIVGVFIVCGILNVLFVKPIEDRVNAEWQEKYDEMVSRFEDDISDIKRDHTFEMDEIAREHENHIDEISDKYDAEIDDLNDTIKEMENDWSNSLQEMEAYYEDKMNALSMEYDAVVDEAYNAGYEDGYEAGYADAKSGQ